ncbi:MAG: hypothetical protein A2Y40_01965 [Candidatus Margulisbacteria bacterium GWF2_35_9]|nr:MAG: hypothetical protein A2Y40_01965 [Candidatus Margulisbacteria bacterium GWF2_35_9]
MSPLINIFKKKSSTSNVQSIIDKYNKDQTRLMDILIDIQAEIGYISNESASLIANQLKISKVDVEQTLSFYHFFSQKETGKYTIYLNDSAVAEMMGRNEVAKAFEEAAGSKFGEVTKDGKIGLFNTSCIGMNDQEPAAIINGVIFTRITPYRAKEIIQDMKNGKAVNEMGLQSFGDGNNSSNYIQSMVSNNIRRKGPVIFSDYNLGKSIKKIVNMKPTDVIRDVKASNVRGRGGAGFPTGMKWEFCRNAAGDQRYIFCNADEGEPGTFKDRVILTELPKLIFEGMTVAGYAVGATEGILYLRYEYKYLQKYLEQVLEELKTANLLGTNIGGKNGFNFNIRIQFGAGAYVCGEESALIESAEGKRGEPRDRPPFPVEQGYLNKPTVVNNVETLCSVVKIITEGPNWYKSFGTKDSAGTKVLSISGDCMNPGIYEIEWGFNINDILKMVGANDVQAVQVGGPSGALIAPTEFDRILCYSDLSTGGSIIIFNSKRDLLKNVVLNFMDFFIEESCGSCVPCRCLTVLFREKLLKILKGNGVMQDIDDMISWGPTMLSNRCGLGHTAANPILTSIKNFRPLYESKIQQNKLFDSGFNLQEAIAECCEATGRQPIL